MTTYGHFVTLAARSHGTKRKGRRVGDVIGVIWPYVSVAEIEKLDAKVFNLHTDIMDLKVAKPPDGSAPSAWTEHLMTERRLAAFQVEWWHYRSTWDVWKRDHYGEISRTGDATRQSFDDIRGGYNEYLRRYKADWQGATDAKPAESDAGKESPIEKGLSTVRIASYAVLAGIGIYAYTQLKD